MESLLRVITRLYFTMIYRPNIMSTPDRGDKGPCNPRHAWLSCARGAGGDQTQ